MGKKLARWTAALLGAFALFPMSAAAFTSLGTPFSAQSTLVGQFPTCQLGTSGTAGPMGGLDDSTNVYFTDWCSDTLYRFDPSVLTGGGSATAPAASKANGLDGGLALSHGVYYGVAQTKSHCVMGGLLPRAEPGPLTPLPAVSDWLPITNCVTVGCAESGF